MTTKDYIANMHSFLKEWMISKIQEELDNLYNLRELSVETFYFLMNTSDRIHWIISSGLDYTEVKKRIFS